MKFDITIRGIAPMLMHRFSEEKLLKTKKVTGDKRLNEDEQRELASQYLYLDGKKLMCPALHIEHAMTKSATELRLSGSGKKTYKDLIKSACFVSPENIIHKHQEWVVDARPTVNPTTRGRSMCYRPRLDKWELSFQMEVLDERADADAIKEILTIAGLRNGLGSYRPRYGRFEVVTFNKIKE